MGARAFRYSAFGLVLESAIELPELLIAPSASSADVIISETPNLTSKPVNERRLFLRLPGVAEFCVEEGSHVSVRREPEGCLDSLRLFLLGSVMGALLQQRGFIVLHGNAISLGEAECRVVVGHSGAGKSTLAAWHYVRGAEIVSDDICAIQVDAQGRAWVVPGIPQLKLWRKSADLLCISTEGLRRIRPGFDKYRLVLSGRHAKSRRPLTEIQEIDPLRTETVPLVGAAKIQRILLHGYRSSFVRQMGLEAGYTRKVVELAALIRMQSVPRRDLEPNRA